MGLLRATCGVAFILYLFLTSFYGCILFFFVPMLLFSHIAYVPLQKYKSFLLYSWATTFILVIEFLFGVKIVLTTDNKEPAAVLRREVAVVICNHRSEVDWLFLFNLAWRAAGGNMIGELRIMLKSMMKKLPGPGWVMTLYPFPFVERRWDLDKPSVTKFCKNHLETKQPMWLTLYPEGTAVYARSLKRSQKFMKDQGLEPWEHVLYPRTKGFGLCVDLLSPNTALYDITLAYPEMCGNRLEMRPTPPRILFGSYPTSVHMHINRYERSELPNDEEGIANWLLDVFKQKEGRLKQFYETTDGSASFGGKPLPHQGLGLLDWALFVWWVYFSFQSMYYVFYFPWLRWLSLAVIAGFNLNAYITSPKVQHSKAF